METNRSAVDTRLVMFDCSFIRFGTFSKRTSDIKQFFFRWLLNLAKTKIVKSKKLKSLQLYFDSDITIGISLQQHKRIVFPSVVIHTTTSIAAFPFTALFFKKCNSFFIFFLFCFKFKIRHDLLPMKLVRDLPMFPIRFHWKKTPTNFCIQTNK